MTHPTTHHRNRVLQEIKAWQDELTARRGEVLEVRLNAQQVAFTNVGYCDPATLPLSAELATLNSQIADAEEQELLAIACEAGYIRPAYMLTNSPAEQEGR